MLINRYGRHLMMGTALAGSFAALGMAQSSSNKPGSPVASGQALGQAPDQSYVIKEIVVTANKRREKLKEVPSSISVLSGATLKKQGVQDFSDYMKLVSGLSDFGGGAEGHGAVILRGLNTGYYQTSTTTGFYVNDVPYTASSALSVGGLLTPDPNLTDVSQIEVLKGPQGTLYGASALGGLIKVTTNQPDTTRSSAELHVTGSDIRGGATGGGLNGMMNIPLIPNELALRIVGFTRDDPGYMTNVTTGQKGENTSHNNGGRATLKWTPNQNLTITLGVIGQDQHTEGFGNEYQNAITQQPIYGKYDYAQAINPSFDTSFQIYSGAVDYRFPSYGTLTDSVSYGIHRDKEREDYSSYYGVYNALLGLTVPPNTAQLLTFGPTLNKFTNELRFASVRFGAFQNISGIYYTQEHTNFPGGIQNVSLPSQTKIPGPAGVLDTQGNPAVYTEVAGYSNLTYFFSKKVDVTLGGRYSYNQQSERAFGDGALNGGPVSSSFKNSDTDFTYLATLRYRLVKSISTYARIASAYRPGGPQINPIPNSTNPPFRPDSVVEYEVGAKGQWLGGTLRSDLALYYIDWKHIQLTYSNDGFVQIGNGGRAYSEGVDYDIQAIPLQNLQLTGEVGYNNAVLTKVDGATTVATGAVAGDQLPFTPNWTASATADYTVPLSNRLDATFGGTYSYQGSKISDYPGDQVNTGVKIPAYSVVDVRAGLNFQKYAVNFRITNLLDAHGVDSFVDQRIDPTTVEPAWATIIRPRMFTLEVSARF